MLFKTRFDKVVSHIERYNSLTSNDVETILGSSVAIGATARKNGEKMASGGGGDPIVFGPNGIVVKARTANRSEEHTSELQSLMRISYAVFCLKKKNKKNKTKQEHVR